MAPAPAPPDYDTLLGIPFLGNLFEAVVFGITLLQTYLFYHTKSRSNPVYMKVVVLCVLILDATNLAMSSSGLYHYVVKNYANPASLQWTNWNLWSVVITTSTVGCIVRTFWTMRIYILSRRNLWLTSIFIIWDVVGYVAGLIVAGHGLRYEKSFNFDSTQNTIMKISLSLTASGDLAIAAVLAWLLNRSRTGVRGTDSMISSLMVYTINAGVLSALCPFFTVITFAIWPHQLIYLGVYFCESTLYTNSLLASLNVRDAVKAKGSTLASSSRSHQIPLSNTTGLPSIAFRGGSMADVEHGGPVISIMKETTEEYAL